MSRSKRKKRDQLEKRVDETSYLTKPRHGAVLKEEAWYEGNELVRYSLAYINPRVCGVDNGRVLGYDNAHGCHHRHSMGKIENAEFSSYKELVEEFEKEVYELWRKEDEQES